MTLAMVKTYLGEKEIIATLTEAGWSVPDAPTLERILDLEATPGNFGPACGDPATAAANKSAELLAGAIVYVREPELMPPGTVY